jgi:WD40 repeat protein
VGSNNNNLELFKESTLEHIETLSGHSHAITAILYEKSSNTYLTAGIDKTIRWDMNTKSPVEVITNFSLHYGPALGFYKDNNKMYFVYSEHPSYFLVHNLYDKTDEIQVDKKANPSCVKYDEQTRSLFYGNSLENSIKVFSMTSNSLIQKNIMLESGIIKNITFIPGGKYFMTHAQNSDHLKIWKINEWKLYSKVPIRKEPNSSDIADVIILDKSSELLIIYKSGVIDVYDWCGIK